MKITAEQFNAVAAHLETSTGIKPTKDAVFSACILALTSAGMDLPAAYNSVFGEGEYIKMTSAVHAALTA